MDDLMDLLTYAIIEREDELNRLTSAKRALEGKEKPGRKPVPAVKDEPKQRRRSRRKGRTRSEDALKLVTEKPGITARDIAKQLKIKPNYLYRVMADLEKDKKVTKEGRTYVPIS